MKSAGALAASGAFLVLVVAAAAQPGGGGPPPARVVLDAARLETVEQWREVTGELRAVRRMVLAAQEPGWVLEMTVDAGDSVKAGQVIAHLDDKLAELEVQRAEADLLKFDAQVRERAATLTKMERDLAKWRESFSKQSATETEVQDAETAVETAKARLEQSRAEQAAAKSNVGVARKRLADMTIASPINGRVVSKRTEVGQWLQRGDAVVEVVKLDTIEAWLDVPELVASRLAAAPAAGGKAPSAGAEPVKDRVQVQVRITALNEVRRADVAGIIPAADPMSRLIPVRVVLANADEAIKPGMSVTGLVPTGTSEPVLTIHKDALLRNDAGTYVFISAGGVAQIVRVEVLFAVKDRLAVRAERLMPGAQVVVEGNERRFPGEPLAPMPGGAGFSPEAKPAKPTEK